MNKLSSSLAAAVLCASLVVLAGCGFCTDTRCNDPFPTNLITVAVSPNPITPVDEGESIKFTADVQHDFNFQGVTWSLSGPGSLSQQTAFSVVYTAPPNVIMPLHATVTAAAISNGAKTGSAIALDVTPPVIITPSVPSATIGVPYNTTIQGSGGITPYKFTIAHGSLPTGLSLDPNSGVISGTPPPNTAPSDFTVQLADSGNPPLTALQSYGLDIIVPISIAFSTPPPSARAVNRQATIVAVVSNDPAMQGVDWSLSCGSAVCGNITPHTASGVGAVLNTPPAPAVVTVTATSTSDPTKFVSGNVNVVVTGPITISFSQAPPPRLLQGATIRIAADVENDPANAGVDWTITCSGSTNCGAIDPHTLNDAIAHFSAPPAIPPNQVTVTASSTTDPTVSVSAAVQIITQGNNGSPCTFSGEIAFEFNGWDAQGIVGIVGSFNVDPNTGMVTSGTEDVTRFGSGSQTLTINGGQCGVRNDNRGSLALNTTSNTFTAFQFAVKADGNATLISFNDTDPTLINGSGVLVKQDTSAFGLNQVAGDYALGLRGQIGASRGAAVGRATLASSGTLGNGSLALSKSGASDSSAVNATLGAPDPVTGRGTGSQTIAAFGSTQTSHFVYYVVSASQTLFLTTDAAASSGYFLAGAMQRQSGAGSFSNGSWNGGTVLYLTGFDAAGGGADITIGQATADGKGNLTLETDENDAGVISFHKPTGTYSINGDGSGTATITSASGQQSYALAMISQSAGFIIEGIKDSPGANVQSGSIEQQSGSPFNAGSIGGFFTRGTTAPASPAVADASGTFTFDGGGNFTGTLDKSVVMGGATFLTISPVVGTYSIDSNDATGSRVFLTVTNGNGASAVGYIVSPNRFIALFTTNSGDTTAAVNVFQQ